jgi:hypothetical protein
MPDDIHATAPKGMPLISAKRVFMFLAFLLACLYLMVFWQQSKNGRYVLHDDGQHLLVFDTRTGALTFPSASP